jgi:hypothetical protein
VQVGGLPVAGIADDRRAEQRPGGEPGQNPDSQSGKSGITSAIGSASVSDGERKSEPDGSQRTGASTSFPNQRCAASVGSSDGPARRAAGSAISRPNALHGVQSGAHRVGGRGHPPLVGAEEVGGQRLERRLPCTDDGAPGSAAQDAASSASVSAHAHPQGRSAPGDEAK